MQTCIIRNPANDSYQAVAIVVNNHTDPVFLKAAVLIRENHSALMAVDGCDKKSISGGGTRVACYGGTYKWDRTIEAQSTIYLNAGLDDITHVATYS
ncbi:hypothetical protein ACFWPV_36825 [Streptomyces uncialis]|uniref:hypothetical protein n=1 Tax=Streptomyces uncialis TaxID=1048205 RepID=UPI00364795C8